MIRAILHLQSDQPLAVELLEEPKPSDLTVICTSVRTIDGKKPVFIDFTSSTFVFPMAMIRFIEIINPEADAAERSAGQRPLAGLVDEEDGEDLEIDEDFLRRVREA